MPNKDEIKTDFCGRSPKSLMYISQNNNFVILSVFKNDKNFGKHFQMNKYVKLKNNLLMDI